MKPTTTKHLATIPVDPTSAYRFELNTFPSTNTAAANGEVRLTIRKMWRPANPLTSQSIPWQPTPDGVNVPLTILHQLIDALTNNTQQGGD